MEQREQRRRHATVLFADVAGFTALSESMDPELVADLMNELWTAVDNAITGRGGEVDKHIGDAIMGVWGTRSSAEDDAERAVRAALDVLAAFDRFREARGLSLDMRVGVNSGPVLFGLVGTTGEWSVTGDAVNVAKRIEGVAPHGGLLIAHDTYRHVQGVFDVTPQEPVALKGKSAPVRTYLVRRAKPRAFRLPAQGVEGVATRMVGRDRELAAVQAAYERSMEASRPEVLTVVGEPGAGKSRLLHEFSAWLELRPEGITYLRGRATPDQRSTPLGLLRQLFADRFEVLDDDSREQVAAKVSAGFTGLAPTEAGLVGRWLGFDVGSGSAGHELDGADLAAVARGHLTRALGDIVGADPAVLLLEDIHWADGESLAALSELLRGLAAVPLLVVAVARPSIDEVHPTWGTGPGSAHRLTLDPLTPGDTGVLVRDILRLVQDLPAELVDLVVARADGNPFYVEELVKTLIDAGTIQPTGQGDVPWRVARDRLGSVSVPGTLAGVLQARLDALGERERTALQHASVVGRTFWNDAVAALLGEGSASVEPPLEQARQRELIRRSHQSSFAGCEEYRFKHALLRDAAYGTVLLKDRPRLHAAAATWIEARAGERLDEHLGRIADHLELAGDDARAATFLARAGRRAEATGALHATIALLQRAIECWRRLDDDHGPAATRVRVDLGSALDRNGDMAEARRQLAVAEADAAVAGDRSSRALALSHLSRIALNEGKFDEAASLLDTAQPLVEATGGSVLAEVLLGRAWLVEVTDSPEAAMPIAEQALAVSCEAGSAELELRTLNELAICAMRSGDHVRSSLLVDEALAVARRIGNPLREAMLYSTKGSLAHWRASGGDPAAMAEAIDLYRRSLELTVGLANPVAANTAMINLAQAEIEGGDVDAGEPRARQVLARRWSQGDVDDAAFAALVLAQARIARGEVAAGLAILGGVLRDERIKGIDEEVERILGVHGLDPADAEAGMAAGAGALADVVEELLAES